MKKKVRTKELPRSIDWDSPIVLPEGMSEEDGKFMRALLGDAAPGVDKRRTGNRQSEPSDPSGPSASIDMSRK